MPQIDLRREHIDFLKLRGHWGVLRSIQPGRLSGEVDTETGQPVTTPTGTGADQPYVDFVIKLDRRKVVPDLSLDTPVGDFGVAVDYYFLEYNLPVKRDDLILEVELDEETKLPVTPFVIRETYRVVKAEDMRDQGGRIEFWACRVETVSTGI